MTPIVPLKYSRKSVGKAGDILATQKTTLEEYNFSLEILSNWRASHIYPLSKIQNLLYKRARKIDKKALIAQRLKRTPSIINKLQLMKNTKLQRLQDIGGCRAIVKDINTVYQLRENIVKKFSNHILVKENDYIKEIKDSGYRGIHLIYRYQAKMHTEFNSHLIEIQLRTKLQHAWATSVEILGTYLNQPLKSSQGNQEVLNLLKKVSLLFSCAEDNKQSLTISAMENLRKTIKDDLSNLDIITQLRAFSVTTNSITDKKKKDTSGYTLLYLDTKKMIVQVRSFKKENQEDAILEYLKLEKESKGLDSDNIVLVSTESAYNLKKTYPNYFADSKIFIEKLEEYLNTSFSSL